MVAKGGARLLRDDAVDALRERLLPLAAVVTPNLPEAEVMLGRSIDEPRRAARRRRATCVALGARAAVVKGGHAEGDVIDVFWDGSELVELTRIASTTTNTHGSGCVFSAAIAARLAAGRAPSTRSATRSSSSRGAIEHSLEIGHGHGPVNPMFGIGPAV